MRGERRSVRRVPGPVDVRDACCRLGLRRRARVLRGERRVPRARRVRDSALPVPARGSAGVVRGLGAAATLYPALLVMPFVAGRFRKRDPDAGIHLAWAAIAAWLAVNAPFALAAP